MSDRPDDALGLVSAPSARLEAQRSLADRTLDALRRLREGPRTIVVDNSGGADFETITAGITAARTGDQVLVRPGTYVEHVTVETSITVRGDGPADEVVIGPARGDRPCLEIVGGAPSIGDLTVDDSSLDQPVTSAGGIRAVPFRAKSPDLVRVVGGSPRFQGLTFRQSDANIVVGGTGLAVIGPAAAAKVVDCRWAGSFWEAIQIDRGASAEISGSDIQGASIGVSVRSANPVSISNNTISGAKVAGIRVTGGNPQITSNAIFDGEEVGIQVFDGAAATIADNDIDDNEVGIEAAGAGTAPTIQGNRVRDSRAGGIFVYEAATPFIDGNDIYFAGASGIEIADPGTAPVVRSNSIMHGDTSGIWVHSGASPLIELNEISGHELAGLQISDAGSSPRVTGNHIFLNEFGVTVTAEATPRLEQNEVSGNARDWLSDAPG